MNVYYLTATKLIDCFVGDQCSLLIAIKSYWYQANVHHSFVS